MQYQVDFGNLAVGFATAVLAFITLYVSLRNINALNKGKIAEFRKEWIEDIRKHITEFISLSVRILTAKTLQDREQLGQEFNRQIYVSQYLELMLNHSEPKHVELLDEMRKIVINENNDFDLVKLRETARQVLKIEWDRLKTEIS